MKLCRMVIMLPILCVLYVYIYLSIYKDRMCVISLKYLKKPVSLMQMRYSSICCFIPLQQELPSSARNWTWRLPQTQLCAHEGVWWEADAGPVGDLEKTLTIWSTVFSPGWGVSLFHPFILPLALCKAGFQSDQGKIGVHCSGWVPKM